MPEFEIPCTWMMSGAYHIEADTLEEAVIKAETENLPLPAERQYVPDSLRLDTMDEIRAANDQLSAGRNNEPRYVVKFIREGTAYSKILTSKKMAAVFLTNEGLVGKKDTTVFMIDDNNVRKIDVKDVLMSLCQKESE